MYLLLWIIAYKLITAMSQSKLVNTKLDTLSKAMQNILQKGNFVKINALKFMIKFGIVSEIVNSYFTVMKIDEKDIDGRIAVACKSIFNVAILLVLPFGIGVCYCYYHSCRNSMGAFSKRLFYRY